MKRTTFLGLAARRACLLAVLASAPAPDGALPPGCAGTPPPTAPPHGASPAGWTLLPHLVLPAALLSRRLSSAANAVPRACALTLTTLPQESFLPVRAWLSGESSPPPSAVRPSPGQRDVGWPHVTLAVPPAAPSTMTSLRCGTSCCFMKVLSRSW
eukprot:362132-Chlamydomonas_euryale.AAC.3